MNIEIKTIIRNYKLYQLGLAIKPLYYDSFEEMTTLGFVGEEDKGLRVYKNLAGRNVIGYHYNKGTVEVEHKFWRDIQLVVLDNISVYSVYTFISWVIKFRLGIDVYTSDVKLLAPY